LIASEAERRAYFSSIALALRSIKMDAETELDSGVLIVIHVVFI
jgi:hypothetical protein